jgi:twitching motility protein PilT
MIREIDALFHLMCEAGASDLHISVGMPPFVRKDGVMQPLDKAAPPLDADSVLRLLDPITPEKNRHEFAERHDTDFAYEIPGLARFRANLYMDRKGRGGVFRVIPNKILTAEQLGLSPAILQLCGLSKGLVLVTGPTGSGKSTTLCAMVDYINRNRRDHIITIEDPIEFVHENKQCAINQREVHTHTESFKNALRAALREDPDIVLIGEMRDLETVESALKIAETGHLTFGTLHTNSAAQTINRIIDIFPSGQQSQIRTQLSLVLEGIVCQALLPRADGKGRVVSLEILVPNPAIRNLIRDDKVHQIYGAMQAGQEKLGMQTANQSLVSLYQKRLITLETAMMSSSNRDELQDMITRGVGVVAGAGLGGRPMGAGPRGVTRT